VLTGQSGSVAEVRTTEPPALMSRGRIVLSTGDEFDLDRPVIIGRRPRASRVSGAEMPHLVTVPSPLQDISRSHVEIRLEGTHVLIEDLNTTNGTTLLRPGDSPLRLHPNEPTLAASGDVIDLGEGITLTFLELV
jgi:hypothetical protein